MYYNFHFWWGGEGGGGEEVEEEYRSMFKGFREKYLPNTCGAESITFSFF